MSLPNIILILRYRALQRIFGLTGLRAVSATIAVHLTRRHSVHGMMIVWIIQDQRVGVLLLNG